MGSSQKKYALAGMGTQDRSNRESARGLNAELFKSPDSEFPNPVRSLHTVHTVSVPDNDSISDFYHWVFHRNCSTHTGFGYTV